MYMTHVHFAEVSHARQEKPDDELLKALFNTICPDQRDRISREDF